MSSPFLVVIEPDEDGWLASVPDLPGCLSGGETIEQAQAGIEEAIRLWIETANESGWPIPEPRSRAMQIAV